MEKLNTVQALDNLDSTLKKFNDQISRDPTDVNKDIDPDHNQEKNDASDSEKIKDIEGNIKDIDESSSTKNNDNDKESCYSEGKQKAFEQFNVKPCTSNENVKPCTSSENVKPCTSSENVKPCTSSESVVEESIAAKQRRPSAEEIARNWQNLGVQRCKNCKFTTDDTELFKHHCTTCLSVRSTGNIILKYKDGEFKCDACNEVWKIKAEFEEHIVCHLQDLPYICLTCQNKRFSSRQLIEIHTKTEHPDGNARCGLKGMKNGRKYSEELMQSGSISINGKLSIPKTPRNHIQQIITKDVFSNQKQEQKSSLVGIIDRKPDMHPTSGKVINVSNSTVASVIHSQEHTSLPNSALQTVVSSSTIHHRPIVVNMINPTNAIAGVSSENTSTRLITAPVFLQVPTTSQSVIVNDNDAEVIANRPMPPARTTITLQNIAPFPHQYTFKGGTLARISAAEEAKSKHLDTLFGKLNKTTNAMQPTFISQKIKDIANPFSGDTSKIQLEPSRKEAIPYHLKTITEYTCTNATKTTSSTVSSLPQQNLLLVPVGQPVMQSQCQFVNNVFYQPSSTSGNIVPIQALPVNTDTRVCQVQSRSLAPKIVQSRSLAPQKVQVNQMSQGSVMHAASAGSFTTVRGQTKDTAKHNFQDSTKGSVGMSQPVISASRHPSQQTVQKDLNVPKSFKGSFTHVPGKADSHEIITTPGDIFTIPKKYLFKIKPGIGFVCEACKKCTKDEFVFRGHVWEHFHGNPRACKTCSTEFISSKSVLECKLISNIVCNLIRRSSHETLESSAKKLKVTKVNDKEVIDITDDEDDKKGSDSQGQKLLTTEVIVVDDEDEKGEGQGLQIRISNTFSLSSPKTLEQMAKNDIHSTSGAKTSDAQNIDKSDEIYKHSSINSSELEQLYHSAQIGNNEGNNDSQSWQMKKDLQVTSNLDICETPENATDGKQSPVIMEEESVEDDGTLKDVHLLDQSLSEPGNDSEEIVSKVLETNLKLFDPFLNPTRKDESVEDRSKISYLQPDVSVRTHEEQDDSVNLVNKTVFDAEILSKQSHHAFYVCGYENCPYTGLSSLKYREHLQSKQHEKEYNYVCGHCGQKDYTEDAHVRHIFSHANAKRFLLYKCPIRLCKYKSNLLHMYSSHLRAHPNEELTVKCVYCHKTFPSIESLEQHLKQNLLKFVVCPYCSFKFVNKYTVMMHIRYFHPDKMRMVFVTSQVVCNEREINFYVSPKSKVIQQSHFVEKDINETEEIDIPALLNEIESCSKEKTAIDQTMSENGDVDDALSLPEEDQCDLKEKELKEEVTESQKEISMRKATKGKGKTECFKGGQRSLECPLCSYLSYNQSLHAKHISLHDTEPEREKRFVCNLCPKGTDGFSHFTTHVKNHVGKHIIKVFCCTSCAYCTNQKRHIMDHVKDAHEEETLYTLKEEIVESNHFECKYCAFKARTSEQISAHESSVHRIDQNVISNSDQEEVKKSSLPENKLVSTNSEKDTRKKICKYHCDYCSEFFKHKSNLKEHMINDHRDIENKQFVFFKCKYCTYTSTMKDMIISHLEKDHSGFDLRILRKIEMVENNKSINSKSDTGASEVGKEGKSSKECHHEKKDNYSKERNDLDTIEIVIPDGNVFKQMFSCPMCSFTTNMRIKAMKHLKEHPGVKPIRPDQKNHSTKPTARKSSTSLFPRNDSLKKKNSLVQQLPESATPMRNPFVLDVDKIISCEEGKVLLNSPYKDSYILGEQKLHNALLPCFIPLEKDMKYQCRICKQKIFKRFVLHRHILDHLKIVFFTCRYCNEGSIERTLMVGHIQKVHSSKTIVYDTVEMSVLEQQFKERIFNQDFNDTIDLSSTTGNFHDKTELRNIGIVKKPVHEYQTIDDESNDEDQDGSKEIIKQSEQEKICINLKCSKCRYIARTKHHLNLHMDSHKDPLKVFTCSVCDYRGDKFSAIKHVYSVPHLTQAKVLENGRPLYNNLNKETEKDQVKSNNSKSDVKIINSNQLKKEEDKFSMDNKYITNSQGKQVKKESLKVTKSGVFEMKISYKCKECGEKRESKSGMYSHFKTSKCNKPVMKCSLCSFQNTVKAAIYRHASKRHSGKKITVLDLPMSAKFKLIKIPIRQDSGMLKHMTATTAETPSEMMSDAPEEDVQKIRCQLCTTYSCESAMKLQFHVNTAHHGAMLYCEECSYKTPLVRHMMNHCQNLHLQSVARYTKEPKAVKKSMSNVKQENTQKQKDVVSEEVVIRCPKCNLKLGSLGSLHTHLYLHFNYRPYCCKYCSKNFARLDHVKNHIKNTHDGKSIKFDTKLEEVLELKVKKIYEGIKRSILKQRIMLGKNRPSKLDKMELVEEGIRRQEKLFYCDFCQYYSDRRATVRNHVLTIHAGINKKRPLEIDSDTELQAKKISKKNYNSDAEEGDENEVQEDEQQPLKYKVVKTPNGSKKFKCSGCDYSNSKIKNLKVHVARNHGLRTEAAFRCCLCSYSSCHESKIYKHLKSQHPSVGTIKFIDKHGEIVISEKNDESSPQKLSSAPSPARSYTESGSNDVSPVKTVKKNIDGVIRYNCKYCNYSGKGYFHFRLHLIEHKELTKVTSELDEESKMSCGFCTYLGKNTFDLSVHIASHMAEMRYKCAYCDYTQFTIRKVSKHLKHNHPERKEIVVDRELKKASNSVITLVNFNPEVILEKLNNVSRKRKYKRIKIETDESSNSSSSDNEDINAISKNQETNSETLCEHQQSQADLTKGRNGKNKNEESILDDKNPSNETSSTKIQPLELNKIQNDEQGEDMCENNDVINTPFYNVESQPFSPSDVNFSECDELNKTDCSDDDGERNEGKDSRGNSKQKCETNNDGQLYNNVNVENINVLVPSNVRENNVQKCMKAGNFEEENPMPVRKIEVDKAFLPECESSKLSCENHSNKSQDKLNSDENITKADQPTSVEDKIKEMSDDELNKDIKPKESSNDLRQEKEQTEYTSKNVEQDNKKNDDNADIEQVTEYNITCDDKLVGEDNESIWQISGKNVAKENGSDEILKESTNSSGNDEYICLGNESQSVDKNSKKYYHCDFQNETELVSTSTDSIETLNGDGIGLNEPTKSPRNVFESISDVQKSKCEEINKDDHGTSGSNIINFEMKTSSDKVKEVTNENVFEKFSSTIDHIQLPNDLYIEENADESPEGSSDNIFEKFSNDHVTRNEDSEMKTMSYKSNNSTLEKHDENNIFTKLSANSKDIAASDVSNHCEDQSKSQFGEGNIFSKFSNSDKETESKLNQENKELENDKNLFEQFTKDNPCTQLPASDDKKVSTLIEDENEGKQSLKNKSIAVVEKNVDDMEIDELISSIEETVNEGKVGHSQVDNSNHEAENSEMEMD